MYFDKIFFCDIFKGLQINFDEEIVLKNIVYVCMYICLQKTFNFKSSIPLCQSRNMYTHTWTHVQVYKHIYVLVYYNNNNNNNTNNNGVTIKIGLNIVGGFLFFFKFLDYKKATKKRDQDRTISCFFLWLENIFLPSFLFDFLFYVSLFLWLFFFGKAERNILLLYFSSSFFFSLKNFVLFIVVVVVAFFRNFALAAFQKCHIKSTEKTKIFLRRIFELKMKKIQQKNFIL